MKVDRVKLLGIAFTLAITACGESQISTQENKTSKAENTIDSVKQTSRPNVIFILADDMQRGVTGYENHPIIKTPNIDKLASGGTVFNNTFATSPACTPSLLSPQIMECLPARKISPSLK
mgnify:CR=1 FL=1